MKLSQNADGCWSGEGWATDAKQNNLENGTYELIGKHINGNPYNLDTDVLVYFTVEMEKCVK